MKDAVLIALFKIPDPITADEFSRRTGKTESAVRHMMDRRLLPMATEREILGEGGSTRRLFILWNEWLEMVHEATSKLPPERQDWRAGWIKKACKRHGREHVQWWGSSMNPYLKERLALMVTAIAGVCIGAIAVALTLKFIQVFIL